MKSKNKLKMDLFNIRLNLIIIIICYYNMTKIENKSILKKRDSKKKDSKKKVSFTKKVLKSSVRKVKK